MSIPVVRAAMAVVVMLVLVLPAQAQVTRFVVEHTESIGPGGSERLTGHLYGEVDPKLPLNAIITDLEFAPQCPGDGGVRVDVHHGQAGGHGQCERSADLGHVQPRSDGFDGRWLLRGRTTTGPRTCDQRLAGDLEPVEGRETMSVPVARNLDGSSITGRVLARFDEMPPGTTTLPILRGGVAGTADPASLDSSKAILTRRTSERSETVPLRSTDWAFADCSSSPFPGSPDPPKALPEGRV